MRKLLLLSVLSILSCLQVWAQVSTAEQDSLRIVRLLEQGKSLPAQKNLPLFFARQFLGVPYVAHTLEVNDMESLVVNTRELDCTTLVENVTALTLCTQRGETSFADFKKMLTLLRYRHGNIQGYPSRLHYFTEWILDNQSKGLVKEIQRQKTPFTAIQTVRTNYMSTHPSAYRALKNHPTLMADIKKMEKSLTGLRFRYIPKSQVLNTKAMREAVHDGDIIAIITSKKGLDTSHLGFAVWQKDGLHLLNASMLHHQVVLEPMTLRQYLNQHPTFTGIRIVRIQQLLTN